MASENSVVTVIEKMMRDYFKAHAGQLPPPGLYNRLMNAVEKSLITLTMQATKFNQSKAAKVLGINRNTLISKLSAYRIMPEKVKKKRSVQKVTKKILKTTAKKSVKKAVVAASRRRVARRSRR